MYEPAITRCSAQETCDISINEEGMEWKCKINSLWTNQHTNAVLQLTLFTEPDRVKHNNYN